MAYIYLEELKEILPRILDQWVTILFINFAKWNISIGWLMKGGTE